MRDPNGHGQSRAVVDHPSGHRRLVVEMHPPAGVATTGHRHCLRFDTPSTVRRVWDYPPDWRTLDDAALVALSWRR